MGGNALKNTVTRRYQKDEYFTISDEIIAKFVSPLLRQVTGFNTIKTTKSSINVSFSAKKVHRMDVIPSYRDKETFGDIDILYCGFDNMLDVIKTAFEPNEIVVNGSVISFNYKEIQADMIRVSEAEYSYSYSYFAFNDCGNLAGKLFHRLGLKHGHKGLFLPLRDDNNKFCDVLLTLDHDKTLEFIGLDVDQFNSGFANLDEIFNFVAKSPYYSPKNYLLENLNSIAKIRDRKRDTYKKFLEFGKNWTGTEYVRNKDKSVHLQKIFEFFPEAYPEYKAAIEKLAMQQLCKTKFNGELVKSITNLVGKELGEFMKLLRDGGYFRPENIVYLNSEQIKDNILRKFQEFSVK